MDYAEQFPPERKGCLEKYVLRKLGLTKHRMVVQNYLFLYHILPRICDVKNSGIVDDPRQNYFSDVETFSARSAFDIGLLGSYFHNFKFPTMDELVKFNGVVVRYRVRGGINGALYRRWQYNGSDFGEERSNSINLGRWLHIKSFVKLCNNKDAPKRSDKKYGPAYKFDLIYKAIAHNVNVITKWADLDQSGDKTTWGHVGFGEKGSGLTGRIIGKQGSGLPGRITGKPSISKGGQIVITSDVSRILI